MKTLSFQTVGQRHPLIWPVATEIRVMLRPEFNVFNYSD